MCVPLCASISFQHCLHEVHMPPAPKLPRTIQNSNGPNHLTATTAPNIQSYQQRRHFSVVTKVTQPPTQRPSPSARQVLLHRSPWLHRHLNIKGPNNHLATHQITVEPRSSSNLRTTALFSVPSRTNEFGRQLTGLEKHYMNCFPPILVIPNPITEKTMILTPRSTTGPHLALSASAFLPLQPINPVS